MVENVELEDSLAGSSLAERRTLAWEKMALFVEPLVTLYGVQMEQQNRREDRFMKAIEKMAAALKSKWNGCSRVFFAANCNLFFNYP